MSYYKNQLESWLKIIDVKADKVLDVGGGSNPIKGRTKNWEVREYKILDNQLEEMKQKPDIIFDLNLKEGYQNETEIISELLKFDVIFCLEIFEYIWNPVQALENLNRWLKVGGILYLSCPFVYPHHNPEGKDYLRVTRWGIEKLLKETGFEILEIKPRVEQGSIRRAGGIRIKSERSTLENFYLGEEMHPVKNFNHAEIGYLVKARKR